MQKIPLITLALLATACASHDSFTIEGRLDGGAGHTLYLEEMAPEGRLFVDSIPVAPDGTFSYTCRMDYPSLYNLHTSAINYIVTQPQQGERLHVEGRWDNLSLSYTIDGSPASLDLWALQQQINNGARVLTALVDTTRHYASLHEAGLASDALVAAKRQHTDSLYLDELHAQRQFILRFLADHPGELSTLIALYTPFNEQQLVDPRRADDLGLYHQVADALGAALPDNPHTLYFNQTVARLDAAAHPSDTL